MKWLDDEVERTAKRERECLWSVTGSLVITLFTAVAFGSHWALPLFLVVFLCMYGHTLAFRQSSRARAMRATFLTIMEMARCYGKDAEERDAILRAWADRWFGVEGKEHSHVLGMPSGMVEDFLAARQELATEGG